MGKAIKEGSQWEGSPASKGYTPGLGGFIWLLVLTAVGILAAGFFFWYIPTRGLGNIHPVLPYVFGALVLVMGAFVLGGAVLLALAATGGSISYYSPWLRWMLVKLFLPLMVLIGGVVKVPKIKIERAFIEINNQMVRLMKRKRGSIRPEKLLILMPHCIQFDDCKIKVTRNVANCAGCGKCEVGELLELSEEFGITLYISTGGTSARRKVMEHRPDAVVAVACERDLTSGLQDSYPLPVIGIVNIRPQGYCMDTTVAIPEVRQAILDLVA